MAELIIEKTFEKTDSEGYFCRKEVKDTITIDFLSTKWHSFQPSQEYIILTPDDDSVYDPFWRYLDKDRYEINFVQHLYKRRKSHPVSIAVEVTEKETGGSFYLTPYSPVLTREEYSYFYYLFKTEQFTVNWLNIQEKIQRDIQSYAADMSSDIIFDGDNARLISEVLLRTKEAEICRPGFADYNPGAVETLAAAVIRDGLKLLLEKTDEQ